jgi:stage II sporulation protein D
MMTRMVIAVCLAWLTTSCAAGQTGRFARSRGAEPDIRVLLAEGEKSYTITADRGMAIRTAGGLKILETTRPGTVVVSAENSAVKFSLNPYDGVGAVDGEAVIKPQSRSVLEFNRVRYEGVIRVSLAQDGSLSLVNVLPLERYLEGVLPHEMGNPGPDGYDALKSQAVAARTYALGKTRERKGDPFDVYASVMDQVYRGLEGKSKVTSAAVSDTRGWIAERNGETVRAYYSACCGGHTSDIRKVWPSRDPADYLYGVPDRDVVEGKAFCRNNRYFRWRYSYSGRQIGAILRVTIPEQLGVSEDDVGALKNMRIEERSHSGRVIRLAIETTRDTFVIDGDPIRWILATDPSKGRILPSVMFRLDKVMERDRIAWVSISGGGNGHGVGMCQNGAIAMARKGYTYKMILTHYYPGCVVAKAY